MSAPRAAKASVRRHVPRLIAWEVTRSCMLACKHCRASAEAKRYDDELSTEECFRLLDNIASFAKPIVILTGGEPMLREDIYDIAARATEAGMRVVMAPCGALIDDASADRLVRAGVKRLSFSLDGATAETHDNFRGAEGAFDSTLRGIEAAKRAGLSFQVNTTITKGNLGELPAILDLAVRLGAGVFNPFLLVPTGRGSRLADQEISPAEYERTLCWLAGRQRYDIGIRVTCAPHYQRIVRQLGVARGAGSEAKGCMGGQSFAFVSHRGKVQICGFLDVECGDVRQAGFDFRRIWETSEVFRQMRDPGAYLGRCGRCEFAAVCGGCRARAYAVTGDYMAEEPFCLYQPGRDVHPAEAADDDGLDELDRKVLSVIQTGFPVAERPFDVLAERLGAGGDEVLERVRRLRRDGLIRRLGAVFDSRRLGYVSTLVAARVPPERIEDVAAAVSELPGVTHNYRRRHDYNLWFTLTGRSEELLAATIENLKARTGVAELASLPAEAVYKIRVEFPVGGERPTPPDEAPRPVPPPAEQPLSDADMQLVRLIQEDLPLAEAPFAELGRRIGWPADRVVARIREWLAAGVVRRFGAIVRHRRLGFRANGMAVFRVPPEKVDDAGCRLAARPEISHCYRRPPLGDFPYNLYAMLHGRSEDQVISLARDLASELGVDDWQVLFSTAEYKKTSMKYFVE